MYFPMGFGVHRDVHATLPIMTTITPAMAEEFDEPPASMLGASLANWRRWLKPRPAHASLIVTAVVAVKAFEMSFVALHGLAITNLVLPDLASNVPIAIDGLVIGSMIATASFKKFSAGWWYATGLFVLSTLVSVAGNVEYALEIGGSTVSVAIYAGMPLALLFAVHLTLMLWQQGRTTGRAEVPAVPQHASASAPTKPDPEAHTAPMRLDPIDIVAKTELAAVPFIAEQPVQAKISPIKVTDGRQVVPAAVRV
ncbi:DUF2637 domain-containing protein [Nocardia sp. GCM10030253]|uniref:DUF2637 domain-containing protein n=1 Tax=Nocardia sp. GCM10030253 TaxID=3273404 RepID=UPI00362AB297